MAKLDLNTVDGLTRLMAEMNDIIGKKIQNAKLNESIKNIDNISFIECKQIFENITDKLYESENGKKCISKYTKTIKESKELKDLYLVSEMLKNTKNTYVSNPNVFINETVSLVNKLNRKKLNEGISKLKSIVKESVKISGINSEDVNTAINENRTINESIDYIFMNKKNVNNLLEYTNNLNNVIEYVNENCKKENIVESTEDATFKDLKNVFSNDLELWENVVIEKITLCGISGESKKGIFEEYKTSCLNLIDETLEDDDITLETKSHLSLMKEQLNGKEFVEDKANDDILKLANLENTLKN